MTCASEGEMTSLLSREALFLFNNLLFMGILVVCFWGVIYPADLRTVHRAEGDGRPAVLRARHRSAVRRAAVLDGRRAAFSLGSFDLQNAGQGHLEARDLSRWWCW